MRYGLKWVLIRQKNYVICHNTINITYVKLFFFSSVPYLIYQEYIEMGTLKDFLMRNYQQSSSGNSYKQAIPDYDKNLQLTTFAADICEGMVFLAKETVRLTKILLILYMFLCSPS